MNSSYLVLSPEGHATRSVIHSSRETGRSGPLRLAFVWDHLFRGDEINAAIQQSLASPDHDVTFLGHELFGDIHGSDERAVVADIPDKMLEYRVSAAIVGVGA